MHKYYLEVIYEKTKDKKRSKKNNLITFSAILAIGIVILALGIIIDGLFIIALIFGGCFILLSPYVWYLGNKAIKHSFCPYCETKYDYDEDVRWDEEEIIETENKTTSVVEFTCTCPKCREEYTFQDKFIIASYDKNKGVWNERNLSQLVKKHFVK